MRARTVNEAVKFERGSDPKAGLNIGKAAKAKEMLEREYGDRGTPRFNPYSYKIHSLDNIEVRYTDRFKEGVRDAKQPPKGLDDVWILKYSEIDQFDVGYYESSSYHGTNSWVINKRSMRWRTLSRMSIESEIYMSIHHGKEEAEVIAKALNDHYGTVDGFELVEHRKEE